MPATHPPSATPDPELAPGAIIIVALLLLAAIAQASIIAIEGLGWSPRNILYTIFLPMVPTLGWVLFSSRWRKSPEEAHLCFTLAAIAFTATAFVSGGHIAYYLGRDRELVDPLLSKIDAGLGFDWKAMLAWADAHPFLTDWAKTIYNSYPVEALVLLVALYLFRQAGRAQVLLTANILVLVAVHVAVVYMPAVGTYTFYGIEPSDHPHIDPEYKAVHVPEVMGLRDGSVSDVTRVVVGIVTFPSYHAAAAVVYAWGWWGIRGVRWAALAYNGLIIAATPLHGSHYLIDCIVGIMIAVACIAVTLRFRPVAIRWLSKAGRKPSPLQPPLPEGAKATVG